MRITDEALLTMLAAVKGATLAYRKDVETVGMKTIGRWYTKVMLRYLLDRGAREVVSQTRELYSRQLDFTVSSGRWTVDSCDFRAGVWPRLFHDGKVWYPSVKQLPTVLTWLCQAGAVTVDEFQTVFADLSNERAAV